MADKENLPDSHDYEDSPNPKRRVSLKLDKQQPTTLLKKFPNFQKDLFHQILLRALVGPESALWIGFMP